MEIKVRTVPVHLDETTDRKKAEIEQPRIYKIRDIIKILKTHLEVLDTGYYFYRYLRTLRKETNLSDEILNGFFNDMRMMTILETDENERIYTTCKRIDGENIRGIYLRKEPFDWLESKLKE